MLKFVKGKWALVSKKTQRPLAYYKGSGKPSDEWVQKQEKRIQYFKHGLGEASYVGNIGIMEIMSFYKKATLDQKKKLDTLIKSKKNKEAWNFIQDVTGVKLHKSVHEEKKSPNPDILPKSGAGAWGTDELVKTYAKDTPGQIKSFKEWKKHK